MCGWVPLDVTELLHVSGADPALALTVASLAGRTCLFPPPFMGLLLSREAASHLRGESL